ncbi:MAG: hypothetical protein BWY51_00537 [Parcubacteria group bacterium ADurb.Bin316]|nr:MAG: hypothetical protein BWY51_00537 [Parcubacteria group bacterium ADurb.Bin316]HOZ55625.1 pilin [bacterium]
MQKNNQPVDGSLRKVNLIIKKSKKQICSFFLLFALFFTFVFISSAAQAGTLWDMQMGKTAIGEKFGATDGQPADAKDTIIEVVKVFLSFMGILMTIMIIWAGVRWMTAGGDEKKVEKAKSHLLAAVIGAVIILAAWVISFIVIDTTRKAITNSIW